LSLRQIENSILPFNNVDVYSMFRFHPEAVQDDNENENDIVRAIPFSTSHPRGRFDTVVVIDSDSAEATGLEGKYDRHLVSTTIFTYIN
jgi:hypothetical protein